MSKRMIRKLKRKFNLKPFTSLGSSSLYNLIKFSKRTEFGYFKRMPSDIVEETMGSFPAEKGDGIKTELVEIFKEIKRTIDDSEYITKKMCSRASPESICRVLSQDEVRIKLFSEDCDIYTVISETDSICSIVVEGKACYGDEVAQRDHLPMPSVPEVSLCSDMSMEIEGDFVVHSYFEDDLIIDVRFQKLREVFVYRIAPMEENSYGYNSNITLYYDRTMAVQFPNYLAFQLRIRQDEYLSIASGFPYITSPMEREFRREVEVCKGAMYVEFYTDVPDDYSFTVHRPSSGEIVYDIYKVITSRKGKSGAFDCERKRSTGGGPYSEVQQK